MRYAFTRKVQVALLILGSAILLFSCEKRQEAVAAKNETGLMTEYSENLSIVMSQNGRRSYFFETPLLEGYTLGAEPYREFRKGIKITTYQDDSLSQVDMVLTANYAIYYEKRELWEAKGDVVGRKFDGKQLYTQQLFWDARTGQVYSNVDTKLVQGNNVSVGESFEATEDLSDWRFRYQKSRVEVEFAEGEGGDSTAVQPRPTRRASSVDSSTQSRSTQLKAPAEPLVQKSPRRLPRPQGQSSLQRRHRPVEAGKMEPLQTEGAKLEPRQLEPVAAPLEARPLEK